MQIYIVYYFPNLVRPWLPNVKGKVGYRKSFTTQGNRVDPLIVNKNLYNSIIKRLKLPYSEPDLSDLRILEEFIGTKAQARELELYYQELFNCLDHISSPWIKEKLKIKKLGKSRDPFSPEWRDNMKIGSAKMETPTCPNCGKTMKLNIFRGRGHGPNCKQNRRF